MIWESWPWKRELQRTASELRRRRTQQRWPEASLVKIERMVFIAAYSVRKLLEAHKLSDEAEEMKIHVTLFPPTGDTVDSLNWHRLDELYRLDTPRHEEVSLRDFCNYFIHSFLFVVDASDDFRGAYVTSDRSRRRGLFILRCGYDYRRP